MVPLWFLAVAVLLNIILDFLFILFFNWGVEGAGWATVISQAVSAIGLCFLYFFEVSGTPDRPEGYAHGMENSQGNRFIFRPDLCPAIGDEFRDTDGAGLN